MRRQPVTRLFLLLLAIAVAITASVRLKADSGTCNGVLVTVPFTDVSGNAFFCQIAGAFFSGLTNGTSATTYDPGSVVTRDQMAAFTTRTLDQSLKRGSRRGALNQWWTTTPHIDIDLGTTIVGTFPFVPQSDGADIWVPNFGSNNVSRVRASDGKLLDTWPGPTEPIAALCAMGRVFVTSQTNPGSLYMIDPAQPAGTATLVANNLGIFPQGIAFDGNRIWTANFGTAVLAGSVSIVTPGASLPWSVTTVSTGFTQLQGILYDGNNIWVTDSPAGKLFKLGSNGAILQTITVGTFPEFLTFDGTNIWVPNALNDTITVVRAATGTILATLTGNGLIRPHSAAFDGERILVTNINGGGVVSLWKASDLTPLGSFPAMTGSGPVTAVCSDGLYFWITGGSNKLARF